MSSFHAQLISATLRKVLKRLHYPLEIMLVCVRWYAAYPLSLRNLEEMMAERGVNVDHATVHRWALKILPVLAAVFRQRKRPVRAHECSRDRAGGQAAGRGAIRSCEVGSLSCGDLAIPPAPHSRGSSRRSIADLCNACPIVRRWPSSAG